jgi:hypothetical protein
MLDKPHKSRNDNATRRPDAAIAKPGATPKKPGLKVKTGLSSGGIDPANNRSWRMLVRAAEKELSAAERDIRAAEELVSGLA